MNMSLSRDIFSTSIGTSWVSVEELDDEVEAVDIGRLSTMMRVFDRQKV